MAVVLSSYFKMFVFAMMVRLLILIFQVHLAYSCSYVFNLLVVNEWQVWEFSPLMAFIIDMLVLSSNTVALKGTAFSPHQW